MTIFPDRYVFYLQAYDQLGQHLYGDHWTRNEIRARKVQPPERVEAEHRKLDVEMESVWAEVEALRAHRKSKMLDPNARRETELQETQLLDKVQAINAKRFEQPYQRERHTRDYDTYVRGQITADKLLTAFKSGKLRAAFGLDPTTLPPELWHGAEGFRLYPHLSMAVVPPTVAASRRGSIMVERLEFETWLQSVVPVVPELQEPPTPEDLCEKWLRNLLDRGEVPKPKAEYRDLAMKEIEGLSWRKFDQVHARVVPPELRKAGRPRKS